MLLLKLVSRFSYENLESILREHLQHHLLILESLKSKEELVGEIIGLLQSPAKNVLSGLQSAGGKIAGILKTLEQRA